MKALATILLCVSLAACSKEEVVSTGVVKKEVVSTGAVKKKAVSTGLVFATTFTIHYRKTHNATLSMQCANSTKEKYDNLSDKEKIARFSPILFRGIVASQECVTSQLKYADELSKNPDIGSVPLPNTCFEGGRIPAMEAVAPAVEDFMVPECRNHPAFKGSPK